MLEYHFIYTVFSDQFPNGYTFIYNRFYLFDYN
jgi:hypothetical protein